MNLIREKHYGEEVTVNTDTESMRKKECLCLHCGSMKTCEFAAKFFDGCKEGNIALIVTRCRNWNFSVTV